MLFLYAKHGGLRNLIHSLIIPFDFRITNSRIAVPVKIVSQLSLMLAVWIFKKLAESTDSASEATRPKAAQ